MHKTLKRLLKHSKMFRYAFLICIVIIFAAVVYRNNHVLKIEDLNNVEAAKTCLVGMGIPNTISGCSVAIESTETDLKESAENVLRLGFSEKEKGWAALVLANYTDAKLHFNNALNVTKSDLETWQDLVFAQMNLGEFNGVIALCHQVLEKDENNTFCLDAQGIAKYILDDNQGAMENGKKSFELEPSVCREFNFALYQGGVGKIEETKEIIDRLIDSNKNMLLQCWSPVQVDIPAERLDDYNICFMNKIKKESVCRAFAEEGWASRKLNLPEGVMLEEEVPEIPPPPSLELPEGLPEPVFSM